MNNIKCDGCGKFISYKSIDENRTLVEYTIGPEDILFVCEECTKKESRPKRDWPERPECDFSDMK